MRTRTHVFLCALTTYMAGRRIYFAGSIRAGREDVNLYSRIIRLLQKYGTVLTEHVGDPALDKSGASGEKGLTDQQIHDRDLEWLTQSDVLVAEVTQPSLGVGYEIGRAVHMKKKILCLFRPTSGRNLSAMIRGACDGSNVHVKDYGEDEMESLLQEFFSNM